MSITWCQNLGEQASNRCKTSELIAPALTTDWSWIFLIEKLYKKTCEIVHWLLLPSLLLLFSTSIPSNGNIFRVTGHLCGEFTGPRWIFPHKAMTRSFDVFFDLHPNKRLSKNGEAGDLRRYPAHYDVIVMMPAHCCVLGCEFPSNNNLRWKWHVAIRVKTGPPFTNMF